MGAGVDVGGRGRQRLETMFAMQGLAVPPIALHAKSNLIALLAIASSDLLAIVPRPWLELPVIAGLFGRIHLDHPLLTSPIYLVRRHEMPLPPLAERFSDLIRRAALNYARRDE